MNPLHSPRNAHMKTELGKKNFVKSFGESETLSRSKFDPATDVKIGSVCIDRIQMMCDGKEKWACSLKSYFKERI